MKRIVLAGVSAVVIGTAIWALRKEGPVVVSGAESASVDGVGVSSGDAGALPAAAVAGVSESKDLGSGLNLQAGTPGAKAGSPVVVPVTPEVVSQLKGFHQLHEKTFLTAEEESEKKKLLRDPEFLRMSGEVLKNKNAMLDPKYEEYQNQAVDVLLEALKTGDRDSAQTVISELIRDPQVEDSSLPQNVRETMAGIKAELLYHATAVSPQAFSSITSELPGPVSQKIWQNVQAQHQDNVMESQEEMRTMKAQRK